MADETPADAYYGDNDETSSDIDLSFLDDNEE